MSQTETRRILQFLEEGIARSRGDDLTYRLLQRTFLKLADDLTVGYSYPAAELARMSYESHVGGFDDRIALLCASFGVFFGAVDLVDCVEDHELPTDPWDQVGWEVALNTGISCIFLAGTMLERLRGVGVPAETIGQLHGLIAEQGWRLALGQNRDLVRRDTTEVDVLTTYRGKTGSSVALYIVSGAVLGGATPDQKRLWGEFAETLGVIIQLDNDYFDVFEASVSKDIANGSRTAPLVHLANHPVGAACLALAAAFAGRGREPWVQTDVRKALAEAGTHSYMTALRRRLQRDLAVLLQRMEDDAGVDVAPARRLWDSRYRDRLWWPDRD